MAASVGVHVLAGHTPAGARAGDVVDGDAQPLGGLRRGERHEPVEARLGNARGHSSRSSRSRRRGRSSSGPEAGGDGGLESEAADMGARRVVLGTGDRRPDALALYENHGYERIDPWLDDPNPHSIFMGRDLG